MTIGKLHHVDIAVVPNSLEATRQKTLIDEVVGVDKENPLSPATANPALRAAASRVG